MMCRLGRVGGRRGSPWSGTASPSRIDRVLLSSLRYHPLLRLTYHQHSLLPRCRHRPDVGRMDPRIRPVSHNSIPLPFHSSQIQYFPVFPSVGSRLSKLFISSFLFGIIGMERLKLIFQEFLRVRWRCVMKVMVIYFIFSSCIKFYLLHLLYSMSFLLSSFTLFLFFLRFVEF